MTGMTRRRQVLFAVSFLLLGMILSWAFFVGLGGQIPSLGSPAEALAAKGGGQASTGSALSDPAATSALHTCTPTEVAAYTIRIHVRCSSPAPGGIEFFALGTSSPNHTARVLTLLSMAQVTGRNVIIDYDPNDLEGTLIGCLASDCRLIGSVALLP